MPVAFSEYLSAGLIWQLDSTRQLHHNHAVIMIVEPGRKRCMTSDGHPNVITAMKIVCNRKSGRSDRGRFANCLIEHGDHPRIQALQAASEVQ